MEIKEAVYFLIEKISVYLSRKFSGKIIITLNCKNGGIGNISIHAKQNFDKTDLKAEK